MLIYDRYIQEYKTGAAKYGANVAVLILVGSFYELYDIVDPLTGQGQTSMTRAVGIMGIALKTKKADAPGGLDGLFAGFPDTQLHKFAALLTRENWTVVVIDQVKDGRGKVERREITRILSPGTHVEAVAGTAEAVYLAGLWIEPAASWTEETAVHQAPSFAAVALDLSTGSLQSYEGHARGKLSLWSSDALLHFFAVHSPKEIIVWWAGQALDQPTEAALRRILGIPTALLHIRQATPFEQRGLEKPLVRADLLRRCFQPKTLLPLKEYLGIAAAPLTERALCSILLFVEDHYPDAMEHLHPPGAWNPSKAVALGNHALTQLNMISATREEDSVLGLFNRTLTAMGRRAIRGRLLYPICDRGELSARFEEVGWIRNAEKDVAAGALRQISDLSRLHRRVVTASVGATDILFLEQSYKCARALFRDLESSPLSAGGELVAQMSAYCDEFEKVFDIEKALSSSEDQFCLTDEAGPLTAKVEADLQKCHLEIEAIHEELAEWLGEVKETLKVEIKDSLIQISAGKGAITRAGVKLRGGAAGAGATTTLQGMQVHSRKSGGGAIEIPSLTTQFYKIISLRERLKSAVREELGPACDGLAGKYAGLWEALEAWIAKVDVTRCLAQVAKERGFCRPVLAGEAEEGATAAAASVKACGLRHPLIEGQQSRLEYVKHDVALGVDPAEEGWLIYGMNASGKSSLMKAVGIAVLLAQCGSFVPASEFTLQPFRGIFTRILNTDNLWAGLSSFAVEMTELREVLTRADSGSLVLGDEVCSGTESVSATALVGATLEWFAERRVRYIFATHLHGLQDLKGVAGLSSLKTKHLRVRYDPLTDALVYERTLHPGAGTSLYGLEVAKAMAIPFDILERAHTIRRELIGCAKEDEEGAVDSAWNKGLQRRVCEVCGCGIVKDLEVHHIRPRAEAAGPGHFSDGSKVNDLRNLIVVCQVCHDKHHAGTITIGPLKETSEGPKRVVVDLSSYAFGEGGKAAAKVSPAPVRRTGGLDDEQVRKVEEYLRKYPQCPASRLVFDLEHKEGIKITAQRLKTIRERLA